MFFSYALFWYLVASWTAFSVASAFSFSAGIPSQCDNLSLSWTGGTAPFQLAIIPVFGTPRNISIPVSAFGNGEGSYSVQLPLVENQKFVLTMSDATGFGAGGTTDVMTVQPSKGGSCDTRDPGTGFVYQLNTALTQCRPYIFSDYPTAIQPVTIMGIIPSGTPFVLNPPQGSNSFSWIANVAHGTSIIFMMIDAAGRQGGSSDIKTVGISDDSTCLNALSPSSTSAAPSSTSPSTSQTPSTTSTGSSSAASETFSSPSQGGVSIAAIAGTVIGALLFLAVIITLGLFFLRKKRDARNPNAGGGVFQGGGNRLQSELDLTYNPGRSGGHGHSYTLSAGGTAALAASAYPNTPNSNQPYDANPFLDSPPPTQYAPSIQYPPPSQYPPSQYPPSQYPPSQYPPSQYPPSTQHPPSQYPQSQYAASQYEPSEYAASAYAPSQYAPSSQYPQNAAYPSRGPYHLPPSERDSDPFTDASPPILPRHETEPFDLRTADQSSSSDNMTTAQRKAAMAGVSVYKPSRFILHTDVEDAVPTPAEDEIVELPPQYSERRGPLGNILLSVPGASSPPSQTQPPPLTFGSHYPS
ncbi:hypothetical protein BDQ12DRAFT_431045 [Crucibulum laeve]|uniref:Mid2 domain-containing protein n=1 Tax=Crucibulum laeve TaxID=68775 RepID=A0A5C3M953_9AGAR|nr:hypothetical protein BDQ12DRAFT_431045 [Crucibulum laeve]